MADADDVHVLIAQLRDVYDVERQLRRVIAKLSRRASPAAVREAFETHLTAIWREIVRLESVFEWLEAGGRDRRRDDPRPATMRAAAMTPHANLRAATESRGARHTDHVGTKVSGRSTSTAKAKKHLPSREE